jgi:hypothetical protein
MRVRLAILSGIGAVAFLVYGTATKAQFQEPGRAEAIAKAAEKPTPRMPDGHPDLNGYWHHDLVAAPNTQVGNTTYLFGENGGSPTATGRGGAGRGRGPAANPNGPSYKAEFQAKVADLALHEAKDDPAFSCKPLGVPRVGAPAQIVQTPKLVVFLYQVDIGSGDAEGNAVRTIPVDGQPHRTDVDPMYFGDSVGHWEGDTLVVDVTHLTDETWLGQQGYFHSRKLHVIERLTRKGDTLQYQATVEDPVVLAKPWVMDPLTELLSDNNIVEAPPCDEKDLTHIVNDEHHEGEDHPK